MNFKLISFKKGLKLLIPQSIVKLVDLNLKITPIGCTHQKHLLFCKIIKTEVVNVTVLVINPKGDLLYVQVLHYPLQPYHAIGVDPIDFYYVFWHFWVFYKEIDCEIPSFWVKGSCCYIRLGSQRAGLFLSPAICAIIKLIDVDSSFTGDNQNPLFVNMEKIENFVLEFLKIDNWRTYDVLYILEQQDPRGRVFEEGRPHGRGLNHLHGAGLARIAAYLVYQFFGNIVIEVMDPVVLCHMRVDDKAVVLLEPLDVLYCLH